MNDKSLAATAEALCLALGRALLFGSTAGVLLAACGALAQLHLGELAFAAPIAAGVSVALLLELGVAMLAAESPDLRAAATMLTLLLLAGVWLLAFNVPPYSASLMALLGSGGGAIVADFVARQRDLTVALQRLSSAAGAGLGAGLCLSLLPGLEPGHGLGVVCAIPAGMLICLAWRIGR